MAFFPYVQTIPYYEGGCEMDDGSNLKLHGDTQTDHHDKPGARNSLHLTVNE